MKFLLSVLLFVLIPSVLFGSVMIDGIAVIINDHIITIYELNVAHKIRPDESKQAILNHLILANILDQKVAESGIVIGDDELAAAIKRILMQNEMSIVQLRNQAAQKGLTYDQYTHELREELARQKFINRTIGSQINIAARDLREFYDKNKSMFPGPFEEEQDSVYQALYDVKLPAAVDAYISREKRKAYIEIKNEAFVTDSR